MMDEAENFSHARASPCSSSEAGGSASDASEQSLYDIKELAAIFTDFYSFLATVHYDSIDLNLPPPEGWDAAIFPKSVT